MEKTEHKKISIFDNNILLDTAIRGGKNVQYHKVALENKGKINHKLTGNFSVEQKNGNRLTIKFFVLTDNQFIEWQTSLANLRPSIFTRLDKETYVDPQKYLYSSRDAAQSSNFEIPIKEENSIYFILDNSFSITHRKNVKLSIFEEWDEPIRPDDTSRKKYVDARESLSKARECLDGKVEDVPIHLRSAIDLALKERFNFSRIHPMKTFFKDANKYDFPLPSYNLIYGLFDEGSSRIHAGTGITQFEAQQMIRIVEGFIDSLKTMEISQKQIDEFKSKSNAIE